MCVKGQVNDKVVEVGTDVSCLQEGFDFAIAIVDKVRTFEISKKKVNLAENR